MFLAAAGGNITRWGDFLLWQPSILPGHPWSAGSSPSPVCYSQRKQGSWDRHTSFQHIHKTPYYNHSPATAPLWGEFQTPFNTHSSSLHSIPSANTHRAPCTRHYSRYCMRHPSKSNKRPASVELTFWWKIWLLLRAFVLLLGCSFPLLLNMLLKSGLPQSCSLLIPKFSSQDASPTPWFTQGRGPRQS